MHTYVRSNVTFVISRSNISWYMVWVRDWSDGHVSRAMGKIPVSRKSRVHVRASKLHENDKEMAIAPVERVSLLVWHRFKL